MNSNEIFLTITAALFLISSSFKIYNRKPRAMLNSIKRVVSSQITEFTLLNKKTPHLPKINTKTEIKDGEFIRPLRFYFKSRFSLSLHEVHKEIRRCLGCHTLVQDLKQISDTTGVFEIQPRFDKDPHLYRVTISKEGCVSKIIPSYSIFSICVTYRMVP